ncbi:RNA polymerase sigma factor [Pedobacter miscanthi]|uniref:RNA polymerase n=1 Tax=Pedobacter miscanthi TaxID=2259170 RepID=A0A366LDF5_9SPHI|nr:sigma-70 family RNA polymerase sigma factor [Pedobacter miscanthi]RBQ11911.1 RNA polymerase [Pedobacter miscanthi]
MDKKNILDEQISLHSLWWEAMCLGEKDAFLNLYKGLYRSLAGFGLRVCSDPELVTDTLNQIFLELWEKHGDLPRVEQVESYLRTILKRKILKKIAHEQRLNKAIAIIGREDEALLEMPYEELIVKIHSDEMVKASLQAALEKLTPQQRKLIQLRFYDGLSYEEVAKRTELTVRTAYNTIYSALKFLRTRLKF